MYNNTRTDNKHIQYRGRTVRTSKMSGYISLRYTPRKSTMINVSTSG